MAELLTFEQQMAVANRGGKLLVSAAAGSGKTKVLVDRLISYVLDQESPANIDDFLIITYTKAAASELRGKIAGKLSQLIADFPQNRHLHKQIQRLYLAKISTVHAFCTDILRQYAYRLDISADFRVADEGESQQLQTKALEQVLNKAYENAENNSDFCAFIDSQGLGRDDKQIPEIVQKVYNSSRCHLNPDAWLEWCISSEQAEKVNDAGELVCGQYLLDDLKNYISLQIASLQRCVSVSCNVEGMEKPTALFEATIRQLQVLYNCKTWEEVVNSKNIEYGRLVFSKKCNDLQLTEKMKAVRKACKDGIAKRLRAFSDDNQEIMKDMAASSCAARGLVWLVKEFSNQYTRMKNQQNVLDFGDLEHKTLDLLLGKKRSHCTAVSSEIGEQFREIMVDEYQDSNSIQDAIFNALTAKRNNCFMVGDVKQSIYQFRLADPSIFIEKYNTYAFAENAAEAEGRKVLLSKNFRSSAGVIRGVNDVFAQCMSPMVGGITYGEDEMLREGIPHIPLDEPEVSLYALDVQADTYAEEASFVADQIHSLLDGTHYVRDGDAIRPVVPEDVVILLRSPGSVGNSYVDALRVRGIRCTTGDSVDLLKTEEIATVESILQVINNPLQDIPLTAVLTSPVFGFCAEDLAQLRSKERYADIYSLISSSGNLKCVEFMRVFNSLRQKSSLLTATQLLSEIYVKTGLLSIYSSMSDGKTRLENLQTFFQIVSDYEANGPRELGRLLEFLDSCRERGLTANGVQQENGAVTVMSIHKSKGLEFPVVFLCGLSRTFNQESARGQVLCDKDLGLGLSCVDSNQRVRYPSVSKRAISTKIQRESISEEMRVLYVAMTRAKDRLVMTYAKKNLPSVLQEIAMRLDMSSPELITTDVDCPGDWILQAALTRTEAGQLFALAGHPDCVVVRDHPWKIAVIDSVELKAPVSREEIEICSLPKNIYDKLSADLLFDYQWKGATQIPSKLTATQMKGRAVDNEIAEESNVRKTMLFRKPGTAAFSGKHYGNVIHTILQYIRFEVCLCPEDIEKDVRRMVDEKFISPEEAEMANIEKLFKFFQTPLGKKLRTSQNVLREFKFSLLDRADKYYSDAADEQILLQGVVDCALLEDDGMTVLDFKTDYVTEDSISSVAEKYRAQVQTYAEALTRIFDMPVKSSLLYFFELDRFVEII